MWRKQRATTDLPTMAGDGVKPLTTDDLRKASASAMLVSVALEALAAALEARDAVAIGDTASMVAEASFGQAAIMHQLQAQIRALPLPASMRQD